MIKAVFECLFLIVTVQFLQKVSDKIVDHILDGLLADNFRFYKFCYELDI